MPGTIGTESRPFAARTAEILLETGAVRVSLKRPFVLTSGWASPVYVDCRRLISFPELRAEIIDMALVAIRRAVDPRELDALAGGETAGIPFASWLADRLRLSMCYIRKKPKGFGENAQIEGVLQPGARTLLVDDLTTDARSKLLFCAALRRAGVQVEHGFVIFFYDVFPGAREAMEDLGLKLQSLATWRELIEVARERRALEPPALAEVDAFLADPPAWSAAHGGRSEPLRWG